MTDALETRLEELAEEYALPPGAASQLRAFLEAVAAAPLSLTSVRDPEKAVDVHVADSLAALTLPELLAAQQIADLGSGGGFPGVPLALALPGSTVTLVESVGRKADFLAETTRALGIANVRVVPQRVEEWAQGLGSQDAVCARALAPLNTLLEYAAPLLRVGGVLVAWKAAVPAGEEADGAAAAAELGMGRVAVHSVRPFTGSGERSLYVYRSVTSAPNKFPRRPGMARKRPLTA